MAEVEVLIRGKVTLKKFVPFICSDTASIYYTIRLFADIQRMETIKIQGDLRAPKIEN